MTTTNQTTKRTSVYGLVILLCCSGIPNAALAQTPTPTTTTGQASPCSRVRTLTQEETEGEYQRVVAELQATNPPELQREVADLEAFGSGRTSDEVIAEGQRRQTAALAEAEAEPEVEILTRILEREISPLSPAECVRCFDSSRQTCEFQRRANNNFAAGSAALGMIGCTTLTSGTGLYPCVGVAGVALVFLLNSSTNNYRACVNTIRLQCAPFCGRIMEARLTKGGR
jgi:hypothetical protein